MRLLPALLAATVGVAFGYVSLSVAFQGTGESLPTGEGVVRGTLADGPTRRAPVGAPLLYGEVRVTDPEGSRSIDQSWTSPIGVDRVVVHDEGGNDVAISLPPVRTWKGIVPTEEAQEETLDGLPVIGDIEEIGERQPPPYLVIVRAVRPGDHVTARVRDGEATEVWVGEPARIEERLSRQESMRWPIVGLMGVMSLVSLVLAGRALRGRREKVD